MPKSKSRRRSKSKNGYIGVFKLPSGISHRPTKGRRLGSWWLFAFFTSCLPLGLCVHTPAVHSPSWNACNKDNRVLNRDDNYFARDDPIQRPWSVLPASFESALPVCATVQSLSMALQHGMRVWESDRPTTSLERQRTPSLFHPFNCSIPSYSPNEMCVAMTPYTNVLLLGDSLLRHVHQGLMVVATTDWERGGLPGKVTPRQFNDCRCDGMFSEVSWCRQWSGVPVTGCAAVQRIQRGSSTQMHQTCRAGRTLAVLEGGVHFQVNPWKVQSWKKLSVEKFEQEFLHPKLEELLLRQLHCAKHKIDVVVMLMGCESRKLDKRYPHQSREHTKQFNQKLALYLSANYPSVVMLDPWRMTEDAPTSDGYHYLTDVNVMKANLLLRFMELKSRGEDPYTALRQTTRGRILESNWNLRPTLRGTIKPQSKQVKKNQH